MIFQLISLIFIFFSCISSQELIQTKKINSIESKNDIIYVRVLLDEMDLKKRSIWKISSSNDKDLIIRTPTDKKKIDNIEISSSHTNFFLNKNKLNEKLFRIDAIEGHLKFNDREFEGTFFIVKENNKLLLINKVELEDYIYSVLYSESWPGWPLEVNKAFAIASRSYVIAKFLENKSKVKKHYHIRNTNHHQTYYGTHKAINLRKAVDETKNIVLGYNKKPILAMFDACCGGIIPANIKGFNFNEVPYLKRKEKCLFCKDCKLSSWQIQYNENEFIDILKKELPKLINIQTINLVKDAAGFVQKIIIKDKRNKVFSLTGKKFYSLFDKVKSFCFSISKKNKTVIIKGVGYGHHLGICQWGAKAMVDKNWDYKSILNFYYPGSYFMRLSKKYESN